MKLFEKATFEVTLVLIIIATVFHGVGIKWVNSKTTDSVSGEFVYESRGDARYERIPISYTFLDEKFSKYKSIDQNGDRGTIVTLFPIDNQWIDFMGLRGDKSPRALTVDEILYIIEDSIKLYKENEIIRLNGLFMLSTSGIPQPRSSMAVVAQTRHITSKWNSLSYDDPQRKYEVICGDLYYIISYRLWMHDTGLVYFRQSPEVTYLEYPFASNDTYSFTSAIGAIRILDPLSKIEDKDLMKSTFVEYMEWVENLEHEPTDVLFESISFDEPFLFAAGGTLVLYDLKSGEAAKLFPNEALRSELIKVR